MLRAPCSRARSSAATVRAVPTLAEAEAVEVVERVGDQGQHPDDAAPAAGDEEGDRLVIDDPGQLAGVQCRRRAGELGQEAPDRRHELVGDLVDRADFDAHERTVPGRVVAGG